MKLDEIDIFARTVWGEARGEEELGKIAVAWVVKNRAADPKWWGHDVIGVCLKPYQFSCWLKSDPNRKKLLAVTEDDPVFADCKKICAAVLAGEIPDPTGGATSYYADTMVNPPRWAKQMYTLCKIGRHVFLREFI